MGRPPRHQLVNNFLLLRDMHHLVFLNLCVMGETNAAHPASRSNDLCTSHHVTWSGYGSTSLISFLVFHCTTIPAEVSPLYGARWFVHASSGHFLASFDTFPRLPWRNAFVRACVGIYA